MPSYRAPLRDMRFVFEEVLDAYTILQALPEHQELGTDLGGAILEEAAKLAEAKLAAARKATAAAGVVVLFMLRRSGPSWQKSPVAVSG